MSVARWGSFEVADEVVLKRTIESDGLVIGWFEGSPKGLLVEERGAVLEESSPVRQDEEDCSADRID
jgi:hypothetical protein